MTLTKLLPCNAEINTNSITFRKRKTPSIMSTTTTTWQNNLCTVKQFTVVFMVNYYCSSNIYQSYSMTSKCHYIARAIIIRECILSLANLTSPQNHK